MDEFTEQSPAQETEPERSRRSLTLTYRVSLLVALLLLASAAVTTAFSLRSVEATTFAQAEESATNVHEEVTTLIATEYANNTDYRSTTLDQRKAQLHDVGNALKGAFDALNQEVADGTKTLEEAQQSALSIARTIRFGPTNTDYMFVYDRGLVAIAHPDPAIQGKDMSDVQDADGVYVLREIRDMALKHGEGYVPYKWARLGEEQPQPKIGYVFHYEPWDWIVGTGVYVDDIDATAAAHLAREEASLSKTFDHVTFGEAGFPFILDKSAAPVITPTDADMGWLSSTPDGAAVARQLQSAAQAAGGAIVSTTVDADLDGTGMQAWVATVSYFEPISWTIVTAVPYAQLAAPGRTLALQQGLLSLVVLVVGLVGGLLLSRRIVRPVAQITEAAQALGDDDFDPSTLDKAASRSDEVGELARVFQRMARDVLERERSLRERVRTLTVEIDRSKVASAVDEIVETEYFARLREQASELRKRTKGEE